MRARGSHLAAIWLLGSTMVPGVYQAQAQEAPPSLATVRQAGEGRAGTDAKRQLQEAAKLSGTDGKAKGQQLKQGLKEAESDKPAVWSYESDFSSCGFLTKPHVRADGGGLDAHKGGQVLCWQGRIKHCLQGHWRDRGSCSPGDSYPPQAWQIEGTRPDGQQTSPAGPSDDPTGLLPQGPEGDGSGGGGLIGQSPLAQQLDDEMQRIRERDSNLQRQQGDVDRAAAIGTGASGRSTANGAKCSDLRASISQADQAIQQLRAYSRSQRSDGQISSVVRLQYNQIQSARQQAVSMQAQLGCQ